MTQYVTGAAIRTLREKKHYTQKQLADRLCVSDKTVSKWENGRGFPDIALLEPLAQHLGVSVAELLSGQCVTNHNRAGNMLRTKFYVCPLCGNVIHATGTGVFSCCGITLPPLEVEEPETGHEMKVECIDQDLLCDPGSPYDQEPLPLLPGLHHLRLGAAAQAVSGAGGGRPIHSGRGGAHLRLLQPARPVPGEAAQIPVREVDKLPKFRHNERKKQTIPVQERGI